MDQSVFQRHSQLHQPKRGCSHHSQVSPATDPPTFGTTLPCLKRPCVSFVCSQLGTAYVSATTGAVVTALGLNALTKVSTHLTSSPIKCSSLSHTGMCTCRNGLFVKGGEGCVCVCVINRVVLSSQLFVQWYFLVALSQIQHLPDQLRLPLQHHLIHFSLPLLCLL